MFVLTDEFFSYFLGLMAADGYLVKNGVAIDISEVKGDHHILFDLHKNIKSPPPYQATHGMWRLYITNRELESILMKTGIRTPLKKDMGVPNIKFYKDSLRHFVRGYFDGDGSLMYQKVSKNYSTMRYKLMFRGPTDFLLWVQSISPISMTLGYKNSKHRGLLIYKKEEISLFVKWMYSDATIFLKRKYDIASPLL
jgi:hypothetical protein